MICREKRRFASSSPCKRRRQERSLCMTSVHSNQRPCISRVRSFANCCSVSTSDTQVKSRFRSDWCLCKERLSDSLVNKFCGEAGVGFASTTVVAQVCSTAAGNFLDQVLCRCSRLSYKRQQRTSAECLRMSRRTSCICFQYVTILVICKPARPDLPKNKIAVFADRGRPDHFFRYFVAFAWSRLTKVNVKSSAVRYHESLGMMKCWYSHNFEVFGRVWLSTSWSHSSSLDVIVERASSSE